MKTFKVFFNTYTKLYFKNKFFLFTLLMLPILTLCLTIFFNNATNTENSLVFGVYFEEKSELSQNIETQLLNNKDMNFKIYNDYDIIVEDVVSGVLGAGYTFNKDFFYNVENIKLGDLVDVISLNNSIYAKHSTQTVLSALYKEISPYISQSYLLKHKLNVSYLDLVEMIANEKTKDNVFKLNFSYINDNYNSNNSNNSDYLEENKFAISCIRGIICLFLFFLTIIAMLMTSDENNEHKYYSIFIPYISELKLKFYTIFPIYFFGGISAIISLIIMMLCLNQTNFNFVLEITMLLVYQLTSIIFALLISKILKKELLVLYSPFLIIFLIITHPIIIDISMIFPKIKYFLFCLPTYFYLCIESTNLIIFIFIQFVCISLILKLYANPFSNYKH